MTKCNNFLILAVLSFFLINQLNSQNIHNDFWDGVLYMKLKQEDNIETMKSQDAHLLLESYSQLIRLKREYGFFNVERPFRTPALSGIYKISIADAYQIDELIRELSQLSFVEYACKSPIYKSFFTPDDVHANQWYLSVIQAFDAWDISNGNASVKVAIVDDAVNITHPDLQAVIYNNLLEIEDGNDSDGNGYIDDINGYDVANNDNNPLPPVTHWMYQYSDMIFTHGTHCAGIAGAATNNGLGIASIGYGISIIPVKCTKDDAIIPLALDAGPEGIDYAIAAGADVISLSWGSAQNVQVVRDAVDAALLQGIIVVAAAGNDGNTNLFYPASLDGVISVGAVTKNDKIASFSQRNEKVSLMAPGDSIWSTVRKNNGYMYLEGTSMACPMVAGLAALLKSYDTTLTAEMIKTCLLAGCDNIDSLNPNAAGLMGAGRINAYKSLLCLQSQQNISKMETDNKVLIYPNPVRDNLYFLLDYAHNFMSFEIYDMTGRLVSEDSLIPERSYYETDVSGLSHGIFEIIFRSSDGINVSRKLVVMP